MADLVGNDKTDSAQVGAVTVVTVIKRRLQDCCREDNLIVQGIIHRIDCLRRHIPLRAVHLGAQLVQAVVDGNLHTHEQV